MKIKNVKNHPYKTASFTSLIVIILLIAVLIGYGFKIRDLERSVNCNSSNFSQETCLGALPVKVYIQNALRGLYRERGIADAKENRVYFPEMRVYLPLNDKSRDLRYIFLDADKSVHQAAEAQFTTEVYLNRLPATFDDVPCLQRVVTIGINNPSNTNMAAAGSLKLQDGRTLYFYKNGQPHCQNFYPVDNPQSIIDLFKQAKSY